MSIILEAKNISLVYKNSESNSILNRKHHALRDITFELYKGETLGVIGKNGCGKSSLLRILAGIVSPTSGAVTCTQSVTRALLTLGLGFMPNVSGRENAMFAAMLQGASRKSAKAMLPAIADFAELGKFFDQSVNTYSSGMRARLGFATAMYTNVDILLIDEVLSVGDAYFKQKAEVAMLQKLTGDQTCIFVSHDSAQINKVCERTIWIDDGLIREQGNTASVVHSYNLSFNESKK